jgi:hypothetical protein
LLAHASAVLLVPLAGAKLFVPVAVASAPVPYATAALNGPCELAVAPGPAAAMLPSALLQPTVKPLADTQMASAAGAVLTAAANAPEVNAPISSPPAIRCPLMSRVARLPGVVAIASDLGKVLAAQGYTPEGLSRAPQPAATESADAYRGAPDQFEAVVLGHRLDSPRLTALVKLFLAGSMAAQPEAADDLHPLTVDTLVEAGLLVRTDNWVQAAVRIGWCDGLLVAHDWHDGRAAHREDVVGVAQASLALADLTVRRPRG